MYGDSETLRVGVGAFDGEGDDAALVRAARCNPIAFGELYEQYRDRVYTYLRSRSRNAEDAVDLTQQVFLHALDALPRYRGQDSTFAPWLFRIARNAAIDFHRRQRITVTWDLLPEMLQPVASDDPEGAVLHYEALARLRTRVAALEPDARELLALRFGARLTIAEAAAVVGKSEAAVKKRLFRIIQTLREDYHDNAR